MTRQAAKSGVHTIAGRLAALLEDAIGKDKVSAPHEARSPFDDLVIRGLKAPDLAPGLEKALAAVWCKRRRSISGGRLNPGDVVASNCQLWKLFRAQSKGITVSCRSPKHGRGPDVVPATHLGAQTRIS